MPKKGKLPTFPVMVRLTSEEKAFVDKKLQTAKLQLEGMALAVNNVSHATVIRSILKEYRSFAKV